MTNAIANASASKVAKTTVAKIRKPAKELMATRQRFFFGSSYLNGVIGGFHRDVQKMIVHANTLGLGSRNELAKMPLEKLRDEILAPALLQEGNAAPQRAKA